jgi:hypothetical protein
MGVAKKTREEYKKRTNLEKVVEEIGICDVKDAIAETNRLLQQLCIYAFQWKYNDFNGDFDVLCDIVNDNDLSPDEDELLMHFLKRILVLCRLDFEGFKCDRFSQFVKGQIELEDLLIKL